MICVECMVEKKQEEITATFINLDEQVPAFCVCFECSCNPPKFDTLDSIH